MKTKVEICHIDSDRCVVRVSGIEGEQDLGGGDLGPLGVAHRPEGEGGAQVVA